MKPTPEIIKAAQDRLRVAYRTYPITQLRWDFKCNISEDSRQIIREELARRHVSMEEFERFGRGKMEGGE